MSGTTIQIEDSTSRDPLNTVISLHPNGSSIAEGTTGHFYVSLPTNIESGTPIAVQLAKASGAFLQLQIQIIQIFRQLLLFRHE